MINYNLSTRDLYWLFTQRPMLHHILVYMKYRHKGLIKHSLRDPNTLKASTINIQLGVKLERFIRTLVHPSVYKEWNDLYHAGVDPVQAVYLSDPYMRSLIHWAAEKIAILKYAYIVDREAFSEVIASLNNEGWGFELDRARRLIDCIGEFGELKMEGYYIAHEHDFCRLVLH